MHVQNEKGLTLIEVVASIAILAIILLVFTSYFSQMAQSNVTNEDKNQAVNIAKGELLHWKEKLNNNPDLLNDLDRDNDCEECSIFDVSSGIDPSDSFHVKVTVWEDTESDLDEVYVIHIQILDAKDHDKQISETYGYFFNE